MKRAIVLLSILVMAFSGLTGCAGQSTPTDRQQTITSAENIAIEKNDKLTLAAIRKAAEDAGYKVTDGHQLVFMTDVTDGFTVQIIADNQDVLYSVIECKTEDAAIKNAKDIDGAGYNIAIRNGKILSCCSVSSKDGISKDILTSIVAGKPIENK